MTVSFRLGVVYGKDGHQNKSLAIRIDGRQINNSFLIPNFR